MREKLAKAITEVMYKRRKGCTLMPYMAFPERDEALAYVDAILEVLRYEPSPEIFRVGDKELDLCELIGEVDIKDIWTTMIREVIEGGESSIS